MGCFPFEEKETTLKYYGDLLGYRLPSLLAVVLKIIYPAAREQIWQQVHSVLTFQVQDDFWSIAVISAFQVAAEREEMSQLVKKERHQHHGQKAPRSLQTPWIHDALPGLSSQSFFSVGD